MTQNEEQDQRTEKANKDELKEQMDSSDLPTPKEGKKRGLLAGLAFLITILMKGKFVIVLLLTKLKILFVFLKLGKILSTSISMVVTIWVYATIYGIKFAIGFVGLLFAHEMGHYVTAKKVGLAVSGPVFIPFVGAFIGMKEMPKDAVTEAKVGYGGPLLGSITAVACLMVFWVTQNELALVLAYTGFFLNLLNLLPVHPLDGGRVVSAVSPYLWLIGIPVLVYILIRSFNPILLLIVILGFSQMYKLWKNRDELKVYYEVPRKIRIQFAILYFGLIGTLGMGLTYTLDFLR